MIKPIKRAYRDSPPEILFRKDYQNRIVGNLVPGSHLLVIYDAERLTSERSFDDGKPAWWITMHARFVPGGPITSITMWSRTGIILTGQKTDDEEGQGTMVKCDFDVPHDAQFVELWFTNSGKSGATYYDSNYERNYLFRFTSLDLLPRRAVVVSGAASAPSTLDVQVSAVSEVSELAVAYWVVNTTPPRQGRAALHPTNDPDAPGRRLWSTGNALLPYQAVVSFDLVYTVGDRSYTDDNSGRHYLTSETEA